MMKPGFLAFLFIVLLASCSPGQLAPVGPTSTAPLPEAIPATAAVTLELPTPTTVQSLVPADADAIPAPDGVQWKLVAGDFRRPVALTHAGDERLYVAEQEGVIWILEDGMRQPEPFLDLRQKVNDRANEQGLLGLAFHPGYAQNGQFFLNYTAAGGTTRISRFLRSADPLRADVDSELILLTISQPYGNHNGGGLAFGTDGLLYIGTGDGGSGGDPLGNGQRLDTLLGKILRIDVSVIPYAIPPGNPFAGGGGQPEIWAYGLRNPWRFAFDSLRGDLFIADVGQNQWEEINHQPSSAPGGENYGWNLREGAHAYAGGSGVLVDPVAEYDHSRGCSVTGGEIVRDQRLPAWAGVYLYGDYCSGRVWGLLQHGDGSWANELLFETGLSISSFGRDSEGRVYLVDHGGGIYRLDPAP